MDKLQLHTSDADNGNITKLDIGTWVLKKNNLFSLRLNHGFNLIYCMSLFPCHLPIFFLKNTMQFYYREIN